EIYGGLNGCWDYGPLGVELLNNLKQSWWRSMTFRDNIEGIDASILMHPRVWEASGHVANFTDPMVDCKQCKARYRVDVLMDELSTKKKKDILREMFPNEFEGQQKDERIESEFALRFTNEATAAQALKQVIPCPNCGNKGTFTEARQFNLMFKTFVGPVEDTNNVVYLRPETAQGIFVNFLNVQSASRQKLPFGIAQIGKAFRNEINTKNFLFRTREFEQMEMQYFVKPGEEDKWFEYWREERMKWFIELGMKPENLQWHKHEKLAHYAKAAFDIEFKFPFGWGEVEGIHSRTDFDLGSHEKFSGKALKYYDEQSKEKFVPYVIETSIGASRSFMAFLVAAYDEEMVEGPEGAGEMRTVLHLHPKLAPMKAAILPLVNRDGMDDIAHTLTKDLQKYFRVFYDDSGAIGRRYRRQDEIGTPYCFTVDSQTLQDQTVTVRERDSMKQERIAMDKVKEYLTERIL
ncbi:MAG: glycine--tRNA ligase, partial [Bacteroidota bacterium]|nr:glycine--tRNA ligase [Bacteroidota bacterium]